MYNLTSMLSVFARAGGGGSSSGGDGGEVIALLGYLPMHFIGALIRKKQINGLFWVIAQIAGWTICAIFCALSFFLGIFGVLITMGAIAGMGAGLYGWFSKLRRSKKVVAQLKHSASLDSVWHEETILKRTKDIFIKYQEDWSQRNWRAMSSYMTTSYAQHATLMIAVLHQAKRINMVQSPLIEQMMVVSARDSKENSKDTVTVGITARANDALIDEETNQPLFTDTSSFTEYWKLRRKGDTWLLDGIEQATKADWLRDNTLKSFAKAHGYFYSLDMGWLFIPRRGVLFERAHFGTSDINNHIVGIYNNTYLLQLYTYLPVKNAGGEFIIAQTNVPKNYGNIVVRRKKWNNILTPRGLQKISMEWGDFNKKYEVFATDYEGVTSFELLHPGFMEKLEALPLEVNIEVVDNVVYLYSSQRKTQTTKEYEIMLEILQEAYKQMKM